MGSRGRRAGYESQGQGEKRRQNKLDACAREAVDPRTIQRKQNHQLEGNCGLKARGGAEGSQGFCVSALHVEMWLVWLLCAVGMSQNTCTGEH